ncbi:NrsF family protein [Paracoccus nototheniae]|uniref:NrsF family protein n=1 Tax=Paracoccus nototheniae TaxID=2489002 RepID=A0ABW4DZX6_9RHOB|nr:DUF1109 domain-containing protein [Paracoccus nototheniae]
MTHPSSTDALIARLAATPVPGVRFSATRMVAAMGLALLLGFAAQMVVSGLRPGLAASLAAPVTLAKPLLPLLLLAMAWPMAARLARPGARAGLWPLALPAVVAVALAAWALAATPPDRMVIDWLGHSAATCVPLILALSVLPMVAGLRALRRGAVTRPRLTGALIGLAAGAGATTGYALSCTEDSPLFYVFWYGMAIVLSTALGAWAGPRALRW